MLRIVLKDDMKIYGDGKPNAALFQFIKDNLTFWNPEFVAARRTGRWISPELQRNAKIHAWEMNNECLMIPRGFWQRLSVFLRKKKIKFKVEDLRITNVSKTKFRYNIPVDLRDYQERAVEAAITAQSGIIQAPCGSGKTQILTEIARRLNQMTLILVHTDDLMQQMQRRMARSFGMPIGTIKQNIMDIQPITVASVQTLARRELSEEFLAMWGCVMLDESHHLPATSFSQILKQFPARYRFGTTATTKRTDNLEGLMYAVVGYRVFNVTYEELYAQGHLVPPIVRGIETSFEYRMANQRQYGKLLDSLVHDEDRNRLILSNLLKEQDSHNLILSGRIEQLEILHRMLIEAAPELEDRAQLLIGRMSSREREEVLFGMMEGRVNYIFATQLADEGLDLPILDRLHLVYPARAETKIQQQVGRIQRPYNDKNGDPICYDYIDIRSPSLANQYQSRQGVYREIKAKVKIKGRKVMGPREVVFG